MVNLKINIPPQELLKPKITIFGVGGAGGNALNNMIRSNLEGVDFVAANTDAQALSNSLANNVIRLGLLTTKGLGAGSFPDRGRIAAEENLQEIEGYLDGCHMVFIAAGMGGGTGTGAAPVIAKLARERDVLTVGVVTKPFHFEGKYRMEIAENGIEELKKFVDTLIVIPNQNLFRIANEQTTFESAFKMADDVLHAGVRGVTDLITMPGIVNLDFADIRTIMTKGGKAMMGTGEAEGENRAVIACESAIANPLLDDISIKGAKGVLVNMTGGPDMTLFEADLAVNTIKKQVDGNANIIFGSAFNENMRGKIRISVVATGIDMEDLIIKNTSENLRFQLDSFGDKKTVNTALGNVGSKSFFDPGFDAKFNSNIEEISPINFQPEKKYLKDPNPNYQNDSNSNEAEDAKIRQVVKSKVAEKNISNFFDSEPQKATSAKEKNKELADSSYQNQQNHDNKHENVSLNFKNRNIEKANKEEAPAKKDGFNLFGFMNSGNKKKTKKQSFFASEEQQSTVFESQEETYDYDEKTTKSEKEKAFIGSIASDSEDDIIDVPAFFRKKNNNS